MGFSAVGEGFGRVYIFPSRKSVEPNSENLQSVNKPLPPFDFVFGLEYDEEQCQVQMVQDVIHVTAWK
jgi:hypothetical protein